MPDALGATAAIAFVFVLAGFVKGAIGMGLPTVAMGFLTLLMPPSEAATVLILPSFVTNVWQLAAGPRLVALTALLMGCFRQSKRRVALFLEQVLNQPCSPGWVVKLQNQATAALTPAYEELARQLPARRRPIPPEMRGPSRQPWRSSSVSSVYPLRSLLK